MGLNTLTDEGYQRLTADEWRRLQAGDLGVLAWLRRPAQFVAVTDFGYPGKGPVLIFIESDGSSIRLSEGGLLLKFLETQGLDLTVDQVLSRTVFHAVREVPGMGMGNGMVYADCILEELPDVGPRFMQTILEVIGLRHSKYKDALVQLSRVQEGLSAQLS